MRRAMLMFNDLKWLNRIKPCALCQSTWFKHQQTSLCFECWQQLNIKPSTIQQRGITIQVATSYQFPIDRLIQQFKYQQALHHSVIFNDVLSRLNIPQVQAVVPMPISSQRLQQRGYNQAYLLAQLIARPRQLPIWMPIERVHAEQQKNLDRSERIQNIEAQFVIQAKNKIRYRRVLIIDDVVTTGSSIYALKNKLHDLGCHQVHVICIAHAAGFKPMHAGPDLGSD